jgi:hypothetical protein
MSESLNKFSDIKLADMVIAYRYFHFEETKAIEAMEELARRRSGGNAFDYEKYIKENLATLPELNFSFSDLGKISDLLKGFKL